MFYNSENAVLNIRSYELSRAAITLPFYHAERENFCFD